MEYPWLDESPEHRTSATHPASTHSMPVPATPADLLLEIGTEELPAGDLDAAIEQLHARLPALMEDLRLPHAEFRVMGTPRRLVLHVKGVAARQADREQLVKGPPADRAFDSLGVPTKAGEGFARSKGVSVHDLQVVEMDGGRYVAVNVRQSGRSAPDVLRGLPTLIASLRFDKSMRWNRSNVYFSRPIRWLLALFGELVIPFEFAGVHSGYLTRGLRNRHPAEFQVKEAADYFYLMADQGIMLDKKERLELIQKQVEALIHEVAGRSLPDPALLSEVANLVEAPTSLMGSV
jgi:glycyl-tRNA synthetase